MIFFFCFSHDWPHILNQRYVKFIIFRWAWHEKVKTLEVLFSWRPRMHTLLQVGCHWYQTPSHHNNYNYCCFHHCIYFTLNTNHSPKTSRQCCLFLWRLSLEEMASPPPPNISFNLGVYRYFVIINFVLLTLLWEEYLYNVQPHFLVFF